MFQFAHDPSNPLRQAITAAYRRDEAEAVADLLAHMPLSPAQEQAATAQAQAWVRQIRDSRSKAGGVDALMHQFSLSGEEGIALMCLAEALLRIPDAATRDKLIRDKLAKGDWQSHVGQSPSLFVNAAAWGLLLTGKFSALPQRGDSLGATLTRLLNKGGEPLIRAAADYAMRLLGKQFVTGETIAEALQNGQERQQRGYRFSFDMLGEAAMTQADAERYYQDYVNAVHSVGKHAAGAGIYDSNGVSVKLSALHPRYARAQHARVMDELYPKLKQLFILAKSYQIGVNIDAEEANRLELSLDLMEKLLADPDLAGFDGIGFVVQAYQKRAPFVIDYLVDLARKHQHKLMIRLVKGAYWDSEIKWAQVEGLDGYPVYTRKAHTDVSYLHCAGKLLNAQDAVYPQFATHNALTLAAIMQLGKDKEYECQCLHGMGETLYDQVIGSSGFPHRVRIYAPVGTHETLLAYLVRRLLENGANSSFVNQIVDENTDMDTLLQSPIAAAQAGAGAMHAGVPLPRRLYGAARENAQGWDLSNENTLNALQQAMNAAAQTPLAAKSLVTSRLKKADTAEAREVRNPAHHADVVGTAAFLNADVVATVVGSAGAAYKNWSQTPAAQRADCLRRTADLLEQHAPELMMLAAREAGKTLSNAVAEVREAVDFCRYYAAQAETVCASRPALGVIAAISPWNFPLAIFIGEVSAALAAGNTVVAKPAEQTSLIAYRAVQLMHEAGIPKNALQLVLGAGDVGAALTQDTRIAGVIFTGSTEVARLINQTLAQRPDLPVLIAETGGQNAMIADSSALPEQVCADVLMSAFDSAGQRCSALRLLCVQEDVADRLLTMIRGAMRELRVGNPQDLASDVGPVIDAEAQAKLLAHIDAVKTRARSFYQTELPESCAQGTFVAPTLLELTDLNDLQHEVFGPVLHVVRYRAGELDHLIRQINAKGYALTHGIHSRIDETVAHIAAHIEAGNVYVNRNIVGAVVGVQPFGGHGLSGTGPKAGGAFYLQRLSQGAWQLPALTRSGTADDNAAAVLEHLIRQSGFEQETVLRLAAVLGQARLHTLRHAEAVLDGPTGEENVLSWHAPAQVWLYGGSRERAWEALIWLALAGIQTVIGEDHPLAALAPDSQGLIVVHRQPEHSTLSVLALDLPDVEQKTALAARSGALVRVIDGSSEIDVLPLFAERATSTNTAAAGGNAHLMAMSENAAV
ncbi:bifunctional proline dehydrogenase/L-glutamate gamma-semialdehyde dehydrogenase PutA [Conchiformibius steedae]|uniref:Bifunctional protein PutA n=1 Tax=Conchiformibius steedae TaxID=153493 RepID=A0A3P2A5S4_9NEIS|nr:bifunctional proline dehydrogenase/L-glutamate gamma-semialdehyde dehydrogenase PutA [Conchiformibius steedae]RRD90754.1 bifunctional proline dehydrogenase/L-glutamate gamma-semialdehyde dehydrogenase PutA [Conchiformibius steedae]